MRPLLILQHHPVETPGVFAEILAERGLAIQTVRPDLGQPVPPDPEAFEWHGDVFDLPAGAVNLAASARYPHQAFRVGRRVYGLLFHLEVTAPMVWVMTDTFREEVVALGDPSRTSAILADLDRHTPALNALARRLFAAFLSLL